MLLFSFQPLDSADGTSTTQSAERGDRRAVCGGSALLELEPPPEAVLTGQASCLGFKWAAVQEVRVA